ncbi:MAG TPA: hypothetical protein VNS09_16810 [Solirubrobacter sp.]|nr:hypothetical protein [Solirubrobacter sp.]
MSSEHDARVRTFYDHEADDPSPRGGRRRAAADWGVGEDIFDRMPSRRFTRADRRAEHRDDGRFERRASGPAAPPPADDFADAHERRQVAPQAGDWAPAERGDDAWARADAAPRREGAPGDTTPRGARAGAAPRRHARRPAESWTDDIPAIVPEEGRRQVDSWLEPAPGKELALAPGESRTIVLGGEPPEEDEAPGRKTVTITGHPDRMPAPRAPRPPRTAMERIGASPDRIVGYAVLLGFVLVLIAVLTTG